MAEIIRTITDPARPVAKVIRHENGRVIVNIGNVADIGLVAWALKMAKVRCAVRRLTPDEAAHEWEIQARLTAGSYI